MVNTKNTQDTSKSYPICGLIMPISGIDGCSESHWVDVRNIISEAIKSINEVQFEIKLVSEAEETSVIQKTIIENIFCNEIIICDVSCKNPNVMFELGLRFAFDKPLVIVKDDVTDYSFDTGNIRHIPYPRNLQYNKIIEFQKDLAIRVLKTYSTYQANPEKASLLRNYGEFENFVIHKKSSNDQHYIRKSLDSLQMEISQLTRKSTAKHEHRNRTRKYTDFVFEVTPILREIIKKNDINNLEEFTKTPEYIDEVIYHTQPSNFFDTISEFRNFTILLAKDLIQSDKIEDQ